MSFQYRSVPQIYEALRRSFASALQGAKADTALQPASIGQSVQAHDDVLDALANLGEATGLLQKNADDTFSAIALEGTKVLTAQIAQGRLTLQNNVAVPSGEVLAAGTVYYTPFNNGNVISIWDGTEWVPRTFSQRSISLSGLAANTLYDIFLFDNNSVLTLEAVAWQNSSAGISTRASATDISQRDGVWVKAADDRRYLGTIRTSALGQSEDSPLKRFVFNAQNRVPRGVFLLDEATNVYPTLLVWRAYGNITANRVEAVFGLPSNPINLTAFASAGVNADCLVGIGQNTTVDANSEYTGASSDVLADNIGIGATLSSVSDEGYHFFQLVQRTNALGASIANRASFYRGGIVGQILM